MIGLWLKAAWSFVKGLLLALPWWVWLVLAVAVAFYLYGERRHAAGFHEGQAERQALWNAATAQQEQRIRELEAKAMAITTAAEPVIVEKLRVVHEKGATIVREVPVYVPADSCELPGGFRVLHDAAAENELPDPAAVADAAAVPAQDLAATVAENYTGCHANAVQVKGWQDWIANMRALYGKAP